MSLTKRRSNKKVVEASLESCLSTAVLDAESLVKTRMVDRHENDTWGTVVTNESKEPSAYGS